MGIFKSKPGGTFLGNLVRGVANKASGGILGNGVMLAASQAQTDAATASAVSLQQKQDAINLTTANAKMVIGSAVAGNSEVKSLLIAGFWAKYKQYVIAGGVVIAAYLVYHFTKKPKFGKHRR